jgi:outer membrane protein OmpA-like peptidoglycan-associated protein
MTRKILGTAAACLLIGSCASQSFAQVKKMPARGADQISMAQTGATADLNSEAVGSRERVQAPDSGPAMPRDYASLMQKIQDMSSEIAVLKERLATPLATAGTTTAANPHAPGASVNKIAVKHTSLAIAPANSKVALAVAAAEAPYRVALLTPTAPPVPTAVTLSNEALTSRETIVIQETGMIFRVMHAFARTEFNPSKSLQQQLLKAARAGKQIDIRGRTDATVSNPVDREIALRRALNARVFLANNGIHPRKMRINYMAAGDNIADNATQAGRDRNRRVEIETSGIGHDALEDIAAVIRQDLQ